MITVLVTGSNGQLGKCLKDISQGSTNINWIFKSSKELDITDEFCIAETFRSIKIDYLINCAAYTAVDKAEDEPEKAFLVNAEGVKLLASACKVYNVTLIHISTDFVFDGKKSTPYIETDLPNPINVYGASKLKGEQYVQEILEKYFIIRTSWVYSEHGNNFVKTILRLANERKEINVVDDQLGSPTYAMDLAGLIKYIIDIKLIEFGIYHFSNEGELSWFDFALEIFNQNKSKCIVHPIKSVDFPALAERPKYSVLSKNKIKSVLKVPLHPWKSSLANSLLKLKEKNIN
jgi:dTDP-4-dehydrorhamnose reductase